MANIIFYNPKYTPEEGAFGAATLSFAGKPDRPSDAACRFSYQPQGTILNGTYEEILDSIPDEHYEAAIVLCGNAGVENTFIEDLSRKLHCPIVGGGAAMDGSVGGLISGGGQASVLLIDDKSHEIQVETANIHCHVVGAFKVDFDSKNPRIVKAIDGTDPKKWLDQQKIRLGFSEEDFEHFTLSDMQGINAHLSWDGKHILSGRDLEYEMIARYVRPDEVYQSVFEFYDDHEDTIVFGCAGIKGITGEIAPVDSLGLYMYGEICMTEKSAVFGNLMLSKIRFVRK